MRRLVSFTVLAGVTGLLVLAPTALAGSAFQFATGRDPDVALDPVSGTAHLVWADDPATQAVHYCQVPRGAIVGAITRGEEVIIPGGDDVMKEDDHVIVFALPEAVAEVENFFS